MTDRIFKICNKFKKLCFCSKPKTPFRINTLNYCQYCYVCGDANFSSSDVLWEGLIDDWAINLEETAYINRQQGTKCCNCGNNLRSIALAKAILSKFNFRGTLCDFVDAEEGKKLRILSINTAGGLHEILIKLKNYKLAEHPEYDMTNLEFPDQTFDLVIHSDTLEHVPEPIKGLQECRRILDYGGSCIYTIPMIVGRMSANRKGKKMSYHGNSDNSLYDWAVQTEYGADAWLDCFKAGFSSVIFHCVEYPAAFAIECSKSK
jgi:SAM-dependent methyltransferase